MKVYLLMYWSKQPTTKSLICFSFNAWLQTSFIAFRFLSFLHFLNGWTTPTTWGFSKRNPRTGDLNFAELQDFWVHGHGRFQMESFSLRSTPHCKFVLQTKMNSLIKKNQILLLKVVFIFIWNHRHLSYIHIALKSENVPSFVING